jgi:two-component system CAI-1 autoinducer sensor kinase/phosphatase CqsS
VERDFELSRKTLHSVGWIGALGHPLYWFIWAYTFPQSYESAYFRFFCGALFATLLFHERIPALMERWAAIYWFVVVTLGLPTIFTFLMLMNDFGSIYLTCEVMVIFLLTMFLRGIISVTASLFSGALLGILLYALFAPAGHELNDFGVFLEFSPLLGFALLSGVVFTQDLREAVRIQEMQIAAQEQEEKLKALAGSVAHEMRNPLGQIRFSLQGIRNLLPRPIAHAQSDAPPPSLSEDNLNTLYTHVAQGETSIARGLQIIAMTLDEVSGKPIDRASFEYLQASKATAKAVEEYSFDSPGERNKVKVQVERDFTIKANETAYVFILFNLIKNALFYFKQHPQATITITVDAPTIRVRDTGPGIAPEVLGQLFGSFATSGKAEGTGLGLAYCRRTMQLFGGDILCDSVLGEYTEFCLRFLPITQAEFAQHEREVLNHAAPLFVGKRILVVDDQAVLRKSTMFMLNGLGAEHDEAEDGAQAIDKLRQRSYDLIVMDLNMPVLDGYAAAEQIRQGAVPAQKDVAIVAYTSEPAYMAHVKTEKVGMNGFVSKPCTRLELIRGLHAGMEAAMRKARLNDTACAVLQGKTVLVADDSAMNRRIAVAYLQSMGVQALEAENGQVAVEQLKRNASIDALLLDMEMPVMDGVQTARELRSGPLAARPLPIIALTANSSERHIAQAQAAGMDDFIAKPFEMDDLRAKLVQLLGRHAGPAAGALAPTAPLAPAPLPANIVSTVTAANGVPLLHTERLNQMRQLNNALLLECLVAYIEQMAQRFVRLEEQIAAQNLADFRNQLHKLVGDAGEAGFFALHQFLRNDVYPSLDAQHWPLSDGWLATAKDLYTQTERLMRQTYLADTPT